MPILAETERFQPLLAIETAKSLWQSIGHDQIGWTGASIFSTLSLVSLLKAFLRHQNEPVPVPFSPKGGFYQAPT